MSVVTSKKNELYLIHKILIKMNHIKKNPKQQKNLQKCF